MYNANDVSRGMNRKFLLAIDRDDYPAITLIAGVANARIHARIVIRMADATFHAPGVTVSGIGLAHQRSPLV